MSKWDDLSGVYDNVFSTETDFDYEDWTDEKKGMTRVKFLNVPWDKEYNHIVDWETDENRDTWFDDKEGYVYEYETGWNFKSLENFNSSTNRHTGFIQVDAVYEAIQGFNYIKVEMYKQPVESDLPRREVYYYFITSSNKLNPNTTQVFIELDTWTTYKNSIDINGLKLRRGHLPHTLTNATKFLNDPLNNQYGITEVEPELPNIKQLVSNERLISFQKNEPRVCIATTADLSKPRDQWLMNYRKYAFRTPDFTPSPADNWWYQAHTSSVGWQGGPEDYYEEGLAPIPNVGKQQENGGVPTVRTYSMTPAAYLKFVSIARKRLPQLLSTIQAVFLLDTALIQEGSSIDFYGVSVKPVQQQNSVKIIEEFKPSKEDFNYSEVYSDFAKLYTNQFAVLEVSNMNGKKVEISIEDISESLEFYSRSSSVFPFLKLEAFINGIGGKEKTTYAVKPWNEQNSELFKSNWEDFLFEIDVPTYGIFAEATEYNGPKYQEESVRKQKYNTIMNEPLAYDVEYLDDSDINYYNLSVSQLESIINYRIAERDAQVSYDNSILSAETKYNNNDATIANTYENREKSITKDYDNTSDSIGKTYDNTLDSVANANSVGILNMNNTFLLKQADGSWVQDMGVFNFNIEGKNIEQDQANIQHSLNMSIIPIENQIENNEAQTEIALGGMLAHKENSIWYNDSTYEYKRDNEKTRYNQSLQVTNASSRLNLGLMAKSGAISGIASGMQAITGAAGATHSVGGISGLKEGITNTAAGLNSGSASQLDAGISGLKSAVPTGLWTSAANFVGNLITTSMMIEPMFNNYQDMFFLENAGSSEWGDIEIYREFEPATLPWADATSGFTVDYQGPSMAYINYMTQYNNNTEALAMANARLEYVYNIDHDLAWDVFYQERTYSNSMINDYTTEVGVYAGSKYVRSTDINNIKNKDVPDAEYAYLLNKATIDRDNTEEVLTEVYETGAGIAARTALVDRGIRDRTKTVEDTINEDIKTVSEAVNAAVYGTERDVAYNVLDKDRQNYIHRYEKGNLNDAISHVKHRYNIQMNQNDSLLKFYNAPELYGENTGSAWLDTWGQRGLDIRVKRCSVDIEKSAGNLFYRYGYRTPELWVEEPTLSIMTHFTYWQATDLWITANAVNETNKQIVREIFIKGATVWKNPDEVCSVKITDNKSI